MPDAPVTLGPDAPPPVVSLGPDPPHSPPPNPAPKTLPPGVCPSPQRLLGRRSYQKPEARFGESKPLGVWRHASIFSGPRFGKKKVVCWSKVTRTTSEKKRRKRATKFVHLSYTVRHRILWQSVAVGCGLQRSGAVSVLNH